MNPSTLCSPVLKTFIKSYELYSTFRVNLWMEDLITTAKQNVSNLDNLKVNKHLIKGRRQR